MMGSNTEEWRRLTLRHLQELGFLKGQVLDGLPQELDTDWFKHFVAGDTSVISRRQKELLVQSFSRNAIRLRKAGRPCAVSDLSFFDDQELLEIYSFGINAE